MGNGNAVSLHWRCLLVSTSAARCGGGHSWSFKSDYHSGWPRVQLKQSRVNEDLWSLRRNSWFSYSTNAGPAQST